MQTPQTPAPSGARSAAPTALGGDTLARGMRAGLAPLALSVAPLLMGILATLIARQVALGLGFFAERWVVGAVFFLGVLGAMVGYVLGCRRALRRLDAARLAGTGSHARGFAIGLALTAVVVVLPLVVALALPQHPAP